MELLRFISVDDLSLCAPMRACVYKPKCWIGAAIGAASSIASSLIGAYQSAKAMEEANNILKENKANSDSWYNRKMNENYLDTSAGQNIVRQVRDIVENQVKRAEGSAAVGGATDASVALAKENANKVISDTMSNVAAQDTARQDSAANAKLNSDTNYANQQYNMYANRAANISQAASGAGNALSSLGTSLGNAGVFKKGD